MDFVDSYLQLFLDWQGRVKVEKSLASDGDWKDVDDDGPGIHDEGQNPTMVSDSLVCRAKLTRILLLTKKCMIFRLVE